MWDRTVKLKGLLSSQLLIVVNVIKQACLSVTLKIIKGLTTWYRRDRPQEIFEAMAFCSVAERFGGRKCFFLFFSTEFLKRSQRNSLTEDGHQSRGVAACPQAPIHPFCSTGP